MDRILVAVLMVNLALSSGAAGSILYASGVPYPYSYISPYALAYSYAYPPVLLPLNVNIDAALAAASAELSPAVVDETSLKVIASDGSEDTSQEIQRNQSTPKLSTELEQGAPSTAAASETPSSVGISSLPEPTALGERASIPPASNDLKYYHPSVPVTYTIPKPLAWPEALQFHHQDELGQYSYGYANEHSSKQEFKLLDGITRGAYNYVDAEGKLQTVSYVSDEDGFRVAATNLPQPVIPVEIPDSPEVAAAKTAHLQAQSEAVANLNRVNDDTTDAVARGDSGVRAKW